MRAVTAIVATFVGVVTWVTARGVQRYEADVVDVVDFEHRDSRAVVAVAERIIRQEQSRLNHPSRGDR